VRARLQDRIAALLSVLLLIVLAGFTAYLAREAELGQNQAGRRAAAGEPDYFVERFSLTRLDERGEPTFRMAAQRLEHFPADDSSVLTQPALISLDPDRPRVTLRADRGRSRGRGDETLLEGNVLLVRSGPSDGPPMRLSTDALVLVAGSELARTDRPVRIEQGGSVLTGVGMEFDNSSRSFKLLANVRGLWAASGSSVARPAQPSR
jgi:lipopolysaccharide export system protein LptC